MRSSSSSTPDLDSKSHHTLPSYNEHILANFPTYLDQKPPGYGEAIRLKKPTPKTNPNPVSGSNQIPTTLARLLTTTTRGTNPARHYAQQFSEQKRQIIEQRLKENFPLVLTLFHLCFLIGVALSVIVLQIFLVVQKADYCYVFNGVWAGLAALTLAVICIFLSKLNLKDYLSKLF